MNEVGLVACLPSEPVKPPVQLLGPSTSGTSLPREADVVLSIPRKKFIIESPHPGDWTAGIHKREDLFTIHNLKSCIEGFNCFQTAELS